jgi:hypothetical protein
VAKDGRTVEVWLIASALANAAGATYAIATTEREIGEEQVGGVLVKEGARP